MIAEQAVQCGYCYNGQIIKGAELLFKTPQPTEAQIRSAMNGHICRCGTYPRIMSAIQRAAKAMAAEAECGLERDGGGGPMSDATNDQFGAGAPRVSEDDGSASSSASASPVQAPRLRAPVERLAVQRGLVSGPPDPGQVDSYIAIHPDNTATLLPGYVELGQGGPTALRQIAAEELDLEFDQVKTASSGHVRVDQRLHGGQPDRRHRRHGDACRGGRSASRAARAGVGAAEGAGPGSDGHQRRRVGRDDPQRSVTYADLLGDKPFNRKFEPVAYNGGIELPRKSPDMRRPKSRAATTASSAPAFRGRTSPTKSAANFSTCSMSVSRACFTAASCGPADRAPAASAIPTVVEHRRSSRSRTFPGCGSFAAATSSAWWRNASGTPSARRDS